MSTQNYYIAYYLAITERNVSKTAKLYILNDPEKEIYPNEYPYLSYDDIFPTQDAEDIIASMFEQEEYREFAVEVLSELKSIASNYYIACYQALIDKNSAKVKKLVNLSFKEITNFLNEYPELNYDDIFQNDFPNDTLMEVLNNSEDLHRIINDIANHLATEETINQRDKNFNEYMEFPFINCCSNSKFGLSVNNNLQSITFSKTYTQNMFEDSLNKLIKLPILNDLFSTIATSITVESDKQFSIISTGTRMNIFDPTCRDSNWGYHSIARNTIVVANDENKELSTLSHELSHRMMHLLFQDLSQNPYPQDSTYIKNEYHKAIKNTLININQFIRNKFGININIEDNESSWKIGNKLSSSVFGDFFYNHSNIEGNDNPTQVVRLFLLLYYQDYLYNQSDEDTEFIVILPQTIAENLYHGEVIDILSPISKYWEDVITPAAIEYQAQHNLSGNCLPLIDHVMY